MSVFARLADEKVKTQKGGLYFLPGDYVVELGDVKFFNNSSGQDTFVVNGKVITSTNAERPTGCTPAQVIVIKQKFIETYLGNIKQFAAAVMEIEDPDNYTPEDGKTPEEFWEQTLELICSDEQPCKGVKIRLNVVRVPKKNAKGPDDVFHRHTWGPLVTEEN